MSRVLIVDDEVMVREALGTLLSIDGHEVLMAGDGFEALHSLSSLPVDLAIVDILMPNKDGLETIREMRRSHPHTRIIAISGGSKVRDTDFLSMAERLGADRTFHKPVEPRSLLGAIADCLLPADPAEAAQPEESSPEESRPDRRDSSHLKLVD